MDNDSVDDERTQVAGVAVASVEDEPFETVVIAEATAGPIAPAADAAPFEAPFQAPLPDPAQSGFAPAPATRRNIPALLGLIFAVLFWPAGLVLSALGLFKAISRRTGKVIAVIGLVVSALLGVVTIAEVAHATSTVEASTALDPGCASIEGAMGAELATLKADAATLESSKDSALSSSTAIEAVGTDLDSIQTDLTTAGDKATHSAVKDDLNTMNVQLQAIVGSLTDVKNHSKGSAGVVVTALATLQSTDAHLDTLCASY